MLYVLVTCRCCVSVTVVQAPASGYIRTSSIYAGSLYEERLREFHFKVNRRTSWSKRRVGAPHADTDTLATAALTKDATDLQRNTCAS